MTQPVIHRVTTLDLAFEPWPWPFADQRRAEIDAHFAVKQREKPIWNGRVLLGRDPVFAGERFNASYFEADFASFLAWRDWGFPDAAIFNGFGMGALRCSDGAFVLGEMGQHTSNAADYHASAHWDCVVSGRAVAMIRILDVDLTGEALRARIGANLARQRQPELSAIHLVRGRRDLTAAMPRFVAAFVEKHMSS
jgi:hypothetical protein